MGKLDFGRIQQHDFDKDPRPDILSVNPGYVATDRRNVNYLSEKVSHLFMKTWRAFNIICRFQVLLRHHELLCFRPTLRSREAHSSEGTRPS